MKRLLETLVENNRRFTEQGKVASYIPELMKANGSELGLSIFKASSNSDALISNFCYYIVRVDLKYTYNL